MGVQTNKVNHVLKSEAQKTDVQTNNEGYRVLYKFYLRLLKDSSCKDNLNMNLVMKKVIHYCRTDQKNIYIHIRFFHLFTANIKRISYIRIVNV